MRHKHPYRVRVVGIDAENVRLAKEIGEQQIVLAAVPLATDPADAVHEAKSRSLGDDQVLGPFTIELDQVDLVDAEVRYLRQKLLDGNDSRAGPIVMGHHSKSTHVRVDIANRSDVVGSQVDANAVTSSHYPRPLHEPCGTAGSSIVGFVKRSLGLLPGL